MREAIELMEAGHGVHLGDAAPPQEQMTLPLGPLNEHSCRLKAPWPRKEPSARHATGVARWRPRRKHSGSRSERTRSDHIGPRAHPGS